jgi:acetyl-CoA decarbonylase/synthase complex subunit beta
VITPQRYANCGSISWFDGRAAAKVDPKGPIFEIKKGKTIDESAGEWEGANETVKEKSLGEVTRVQLYTAFGYPHTSCVCFEGIAFYMPEVDGLGIVHRDFRGAAINGIPFSTMADSTAGGRQVDGFHGISFEYMRSPKFLQVDGGWERIVWMPSEVKERVKDFIPKEIVDKIPTEKDTGNINEMRSFLESHEHPIVERMKAAEAAAPPVLAEVEVTAPPLPAAGVPFPTSAGGFTVTLKNAKIYAEKLIVRKRKKGEIKGERREKK